MQERDDFFHQKTLVKSLFHFQNHWYGLGPTGRPEFWKALSNGDTTLQIIKAQKIPDWLFAQPFWLYRLTMILPHLCKISVCPS